MNITELKKLVLDPEEPLQDCLYFAGMQEWYVDDDLERLRKDKSCQCAVGRLIAGLPDTEALRVMSLLRDNNRNSEPISRPNSVMREISRVLTTHYGISPSQLYKLQRENDGAPDGAHRKNRVSKALAEFEAELES